MRSTFAFVKLTEKERWIFLLLVAVAICSTLLQTPRAPHWISGWTGPTAYLLLYRYFSVPKVKILLFILSAVAYRFAFQSVVPLGEPVVTIFAVLQTTLLFLTLRFDQFTRQQLTGLPQSLVFPSVFVVKEWVASRGPWGLWGSVINTQFRLEWLIQSAAIWGPWGIIFITTWLASCIGYVYERKGRKIDRWVLAYPAILLTLVIFGLFRADTGSLSKKDFLHMGVVAVPTTRFMSTLCTEATGQHISIPGDVSPSSPVMSLVNQGLRRFIEFPDTAIFRLTILERNKIADSLFYYSQKLALGGAKIICWNEGAVMCWKNEEKAIITRARGFCQKVHADLVLGLAVLKTGPIQPNKPFIENELIYISAEGDVLCQFYKNKPVPGIEPSKPGNGLIPVLTRYHAQIALSICYDADFPDHMSQLGKQRADILILSSGDWDAISPYHAYAAVLRGIENGVSIVRPSSGGIGLVSDPYGHVITTANFSWDSGIAWDAKVPITPLSETIFSRAPRLLPGFACLICMGSIITVIRRRKPDTGQS